MQRRRALKQIGLGLSGSLLLPSLFNSCGPSDPGPEIVYDGTVAIIGAGAAGLYVADILHSKGVKVQIFEARDQIGGRVRSLRNQSTTTYPNLPLMTASDFPIELGAQTIIGSDSIFGKIYTAYNLATVEVPPSSNHYVLGGVVKSDADWKAAGDVDYQSALNFSNGLPNRGWSSESIAQASAASVAVRGQGMLNGLVGNNYGANNDLLGVGQISEGLKLRENDGKIISLVSNPMQDLLISRFSTIQSLVQLSTPIKSINYGSDPIVLTAKDGTEYQADKVIVTVPISMLKNSSITFNPGLPGSFNSGLNNLAMGASMRVVIEFKKNFWGDTSAYILGSDGVPEYFNSGVGRSKFNQTLSITVNGDKATHYSGLTEDNMINEILADIDSLYAGQGSSFIRKDTVTLKNIYVKEDWSKAEYILGGYSYPKPGAKNTDRQAIGQPVNDKLFFAGEATDTSGQAGMVNGALASAERAAMEVAEAIRNAS